MEDDEFESSISIVKNPTRMASAEPSTVNKRERDTLFLQNEHKITIHGLDREIERLRQQCTELQFQLRFQGIFPSKEEMLAEKLKQADRLLTEKSQECDTLAQELARQKEMTKQLALDFKKQSERHGEDVGARNLIIVKLRRDVQEKSERIANLLTSLHAHSAQHDYQRASHHRELGASNGANDSPGRSRISGRVSAVDEGRASRPGSSPAFTSAVTRKLVDKYYRSSSLPSVPQTACADQSGIQSSSPRALVCSASALHLEPGTIDNAIDDGVIWNVQKPRPL